MIDRFLKAKHWQLFTLMVGIPVVFQIVVMITIISAIHTEANPEVQMLNMFTFFPVFMILYASLLFGWFWSIALGLQKKLPDHLTMKTRNFKIWLLIPFIYIVGISIFVGGMFSTAMQNATEPNGAMVAMSTAIILPLHLASMFGIVYSMYFAAKTLKTAELQRPVKFADFAPEFFMLWFYFVGIWILQPRINKLVATLNTDDNRI
ncbi:hypothetical protein M0G43_12715 [Subsaxibacter sp. CAU 1640]|uniref:hypothetical protein n=1 Tax=Subsaxibacter sp. CAU 1640 TaxID=2933271 RepID=UPI0020052D78|nr:hypothetical protein [Subsaxibacter sp. CAU 1640]MCK7591441.1 hypothetical protein [Subsaxibacter sp. CAU 1640]